MLKKLRSFTKALLFIALITLPVFSQTVPSPSTDQRDRFGVYHWFYPNWPFTPDRLNWGADLASSVNTRTIRVPMHAGRDAFRVSKEDSVWVEDAVPTGAGQYGDESWSFVSSSPLPFFGSSAHQSSLTSGFHQHYFEGATDTFKVNASDILFTHIYLDPSNPPTEIMLQWHDGTSWEHRAYWGANSIAYGTDGTTTRRYMGPLPATGKWVRLEVPATSVGLANTALGGWAFTLYDGKATWDRSGASKNEKVWAEDDRPSGSSEGDVNGSWTTSSSPRPFSGDKIYQTNTASSGTMHQYFFYGGNGLKVNTGDILFAYVYLDSSSPAEVMLQWNDGTSWDHRAYWGANILDSGWGTDGTASRRGQGPLPPTGQWVRLEVPASEVGLEGVTLNGMAFTLVGGRAAWDRAGLIQNEVVWAEDDAPAGATASGYLDTWNFVTSSPTPFSGAYAHQTDVVSGIHQIYFSGATDTLKVNAGDVLTAHVYIDQSNPPTEIMLQWNDGSSTEGGWAHRAYWGANDISPSTGCGSCGTDGTDSRRYMGPLPAQNIWVKLFVPASRVGLEGKTLNGFAFTLYNGRAAVDRIGKFNDLAQLAATPAFDALFSRSDFDTYLITVFSRGEYNEWLDADLTRSQAYSAEEALAERTEIKRLADYVLLSGRYPNKTFIFMTYEGDHAWWDALTRKEYSSTGTDLFHNRWDDYKSYAQAIADGVSDSRTANSGSNASAYSGLEFIWAETPYVWSSGTIAYNSDGSPSGTLQLVYDASNSDYLKPHVPCGTVSNESGRPYKFRCVSDYVAPNVTSDYIAHSAYELVNYKLSDPSRSLKSLFKTRLSTQDDSSVVYGSGSNPAAKSVLKKIQAVRSSVNEANFIIGEWAWLNSPADYGGDSVVAGYIDEMFGAFGLSDSAALHPSYLTYYMLISPGIGLYWPSGTTVSQSALGVAFENNLP